MIVVETSALLCLLLGQDESERVADVLEASPRAVMAAPALLETAIVAEARLGPRGTSNLQALLRAADIEIVPFGPDEAQVAIEAWRRFGRGRHPAALNFGDCICYATAVTRRAPLLSVGSAFARTDVQVA